jgi:hypothetical protein
MADEEKTTAQQSSTVESAEPINPESAPKLPESSLIVPVIFLLSFVFAIVSFWFYLLKIKQPEAVKRLRKHYNRMVLSEDKQQINLFKRHQTSPDKTLAISDISEVIVSLNSQNILTLNHTNNFVFTNTMESAIRREFVGEERHKMLTQRSRTIDLELTVNNKKILICLYCRIGNNRLTHSTYQQIIEQLCDWCWLISAHLSQQTLEPRQNLKPQTISHSADTARKQAYFRPATALSTELEIDQRENKQKSTKEQAVEDKNEMDIVQALEKLAQLRRQNLLSETEYQKAKDKLL